MVPPFLFSLTVRVLPSFRRLLLCNTLHNWILFTAQDPQHSFCFGLNFRGARGVIRSVVCLDDSAVAFQREGFTSGGCVGRHFDGHGGEIVIPEPVILFDHHLVGFGNDLCNIGLV